MNIPARILHTGAGADLGGKMREYIRWPEARKKRWGPEEDWGGGIISRTFVARIRTRERVKDVFIADNRYSYVPHLHDWFAKE